MIGNWLSVSFKIRFKAAWSIVARGTVARPVAAQKILMFWQTMPASTAAISLVWSAMFPKRERSETSTKLTGADLTRLGTLGVTPWYPTASQGALDFLFVQVTIALDALLMPMNGRLYYFDLTLKRVFVLLHT